MVIPQAATGSQTVAEWIPPGMPKRPMKFPSERLHGADVGDSIVRNLESIVPDLACHRVATTKTFRRLLNHAHFGATG